MVSSSAIADRLTVKLMLGLVPSDAGFGVPSEIETVGGSLSVIATLINWVTVPPCPSLMLIA